MYARRHGAAVAVSIVAAVLVTATASAASSEPSEPPTLDAGTIDPAAPEELAERERGFYEVPAPIPDGDHGDLLRVQPITSPADGVALYRLMYLSETVAGDPTVVTGTLMLPEADPPEGGWPLVAHAHGSTGVADLCAPSVSIEGDGMYALELGLLAGSVAERGVAIVSTDYEGLGGPGLHPFMVGVSEGRSVLDSVRAAQQFPGTEFVDEVGVLGYSQGGHAVLWANQIAAEWTPGVHIVGVMAGAPASELSLLVDPSRGVFAEGFGIGVVAGQLAVDPELDPATVLSPSGLQGLADLEVGCDFTSAADEPRFTVDLADVEPWATAMDDNVPGRVAGVAPLLVVQSEEDLNIPSEHTAVLVERLCALGTQPVELRMLPTGDHVGAGIEAIGMALDWLLPAIAAGVPAQITSSC